MDLFKEIDDLSELFLLEKNSKLGSAVDGYEDLQSRYSSLHEDYAKEIENSRKVGKCLVKCLKFYSKLCKKYEAQQKVISRLEETVRENMHSLEEAQRNEEKMKGLIQVYKSERSFYVGQTISDLRKDKEILLDICCRLIGESVRNNNIISPDNESNHKSCPDVYLLTRLRRGVKTKGKVLILKDVPCGISGNLTNLLLRKFKKDLDDEKISLLKRKNAKLKNESDSDGYGDVKPDLMTSLKHELNFKSEEKYSQEMAEFEELDAKNDPLDLSVSRSAFEKDKHPEENGSAPWEKTDRHETEIASSLPLLEELLSPPLPLLTPPEEATALCTAENDRFQQPITELTESVLPAASGGSSTEVTIAERTETPPKLGEDDPSALSNLEKVPFPLPSAGSSGSIFDIPDAEPPTAGFKAEAKEQELPRLTSDLEFGSSLQSQLHQTVPPEPNERRFEVILRNSEEDANEEELFKILREMSARLPSPVKEIGDSSMDVLREKVCNSSRKRPLAREESSCRNKKSKGEEESPSGGLLDSIMSAMSLQSKEFSSKGPGGGGEAVGSGESGATERDCKFSSLGTRTYSKKKKSDGGSSKENSSSLRQSPRMKQNREKATEKLVMEEIKNFISSPILCKEDADGNVKHCLSVLASKSEEVIAKCIVATVLENVDEAVETFERPAPPLTKTQHRLIVLLSVFRTFDSNSEKISTRILTLIWEKLFPDNFFWPDDSVEAAARFYAALCRARNDPKTLWRFCLQAMTDMRQRCPLLFFTVLKTWPDVLHDATTLKNNSLALTLVNVFLHMSKTEGLRNFNQGRKLVALKHLLMNFYQFKVEDTIEGYARKVVEGVQRHEAGADKSIVLLCRCRGGEWTMKHVMPTLRASLSDWAEDEKGEDAAATKVLSVMKQICPVLVQESVDEAKVRDVVHYLSDIISSGKKNHAAEVNVIEVLLQLKQYPEARKAIREWIPKSPIGECLRGEIIDASAENILRELKLNKRKDPKSVSLRKRLKKQSKKSKGKKKRGRKRKKSEQTSQTESVGGSS